MLKKRHIHYVLLRICLPSWQGENFSKLDMSQTYQQLLLDDDSKKPLVVNTPKNLYQYTRLPYDVYTAPAIFQSVIDRILQGLPVACWRYPHSSKVRRRVQPLREKALERLKNAGAWLRQEKCEFCWPELKYLNHRIDSTGIHPISEKVQAIKKAPPPQNISQLRAFLGLVNYYTKFIPQAASLLTPLYKLLGKNFKWQWTDECSQVFNTCKSLLTSDAVLLHYDTTR